MAEILDRSTPIIPTRLWPPPFHWFAPKRYRNQTIGFLRASYRRAFLQSVPWWRLPMVAVATLTWPLAIIATSLGRDLPLHGARAKATGGRSYLAQFADHLSVGLSAGLWPRQYYMFELFRPELRPRAYEYLRRVETKRTLYKLLRTDRDEEDRFRDKLRFFRACTRTGVRTVPVVLAVADGRIEHPQDGRPQLPRSDLFIKPYSGRGGNGAEIVKFHDGAYHLADGKPLTADELVSALVARSRGQALLIQPPRQSSRPGRHQHECALHRAHRHRDRSGRARPCHRGCAAGAEQGQVADRQFSCRRHRGGDRP
jgi:hypothetical protein